jgi:hypothetical protein
MNVSLQLYLDARVSQSVGAGRMFFMMRLGPIDAKVSQLSRMVSPSMIFIFEFYHSTCTVGASEVQKFK